MMTKSDTIDAIRRLNPTANPDFLAGFSSDELYRYLDRLTGASTRRPANDPTHAVRPGDPVGVDAAVPTHALRP